MSEPATPTTLQPTETFGGRALSVGVQSVIYNLEFRAIERSIAALARSAQLAQRTPHCKSVAIYYGDCSPTPCVTEPQLASLRERFGMHLGIHYHFFGGNLGSARGHNELGASVKEDLHVILNPDVLVAPRLLEIMLREFDLPGVGMVEAKQLPIEHPKDYDTRTGDTSWASTACAMIPGPVFRALRGFDADSFFLYCDDVDFSWRVRLAGFRVVFQPAAVIFHDKRFDADGVLQPSSAEKYYSAEAALFLTYKWSREDLTKQYLESFKDSKVDYLVKAASAFESRRSKRKLPTQVDPEHKVGQFIDGAYAKHRYRL